MKTIIFFASLLIFFGCSNTTETNGDGSASAADSGNILELTDEQLKSIPISATTLQERILTHTLKLNGKVDVPPQNLISVSSALGGYVTSTKLLPGMHFKKGELLAEMEDNQYIQLQQDYLTATAQLENRKAEYDRQSELNRSKASSDKVYQQAKADYETLLISKQALQEKLRLINIRPDKVSAGNIKRTIGIFAPFDGYVTRVFVNVGKYVSPSDVLFELVNPRDLHLNLKVFEKDWENVKIGQPLIAYTNSSPEKKYHGKVILTGKAISEERAVEIHAHFDNPDPQLIPGLYMNAELEIPDAQTPALPEESIVSFEGREYVFTIREENRFEMTIVQTGATGNGWTEITNSQALEGAKIVQSGAYTLLMALKNKAEE